LETVSRRITGELLRLANFLAFEATAASPGGNFRDHVGQRAFRWQIGGEVLVVVQFRDDLLLGKGGLQVSLGLPMGGGQELSQGQDLHSPSTAGNKVYLPLCRRGLSGLSRGLDSLVRQAAEKPERHGASSRQGGFFRKRGLGKEGVGR
jgi:hypothetical protein